MTAPTQPARGMKTLLGIGFWQFQFVLAGVGLTVAGMLLLIRGHPTLENVLTPLVFSIVAGNCTTVALLGFSTAFLGRVFPWDLVWYLVMLIPVSGLSGFVASAATGFIFGRGMENLIHPDWNDIRMCTFVSLVTGVSIFVSGKSRALLERRNRELESQVTMGQIELKAHEAESRAAHEIQTHLLPREIPRVKGFDVACAWEPARSVGGDYFDVLALGPGQLAVCLADVSGKGMGAALLMANLQATVRAFAPGIPGPGALCQKVNEVLCGSVAPGKFVTMFYGVIDRETLTLRFENAGHCPPIVLRGDSATELTEGSIVLGMFPHAEYAERSFHLQPEDCLLLTTDGVTEAANEGDEEFGAERVTASARAARSLGAHGIRTRILEDVSRFCNGNFHDDASLIVVTVD